MAPLTPRGRRPRGNPSSATPWDRWPAWMQVEIDRGLVETGDAAEAVRRVLEALGRRAGAAFVCDGLRSTGTPWIQPRMAPRGDVVFRAYRGWDNDYGLGTLTWTIRADLRTGAVKSVTIDEDARGIARIWGPTPAALLACCARAFAVALAAPPRANPRRLAAPPPWHAWPDWMQVGADALMARGATFEQVRAQVANALREHLTRTAHGAGIDARWSVELEGPRNLLALNSFHTMDENGYYGGWADFAVRVDPARWREWTLSWRDAASRRRARRGDLEGYLGDVLADALGSFFGRADEADDPAEAKQRVVRVFGPRGDEEG